MPRSRSHDQNFFQDKRLL